MKPLTEYSRDELEAEVRRLRSALKLAEMIGNQALERLRNAKEAELDTA